MVCHQNQGRGIFSRAQPLDELAKMLARSGSSPAHGSSRISTRGFAIRRAGRSAPAGVRPATETPPGTFRPGAHIQSGRNSSKACCGFRARGPPQKSIIAYLPLTTVSSAGSSSAIIWRTVELTRPTFFCNSRQSDLPPLLSQQRKLPLPLASDGRQRVEQGGLPEPFAPGIRQCCPASTCQFDARPE